MANESLHNVWTFIKNNKATDASSLNVLQTFVMSLSHSALQHLIKTYLQSVSAKYSIEKNGLTLKQYADVISNTDKSDTQCLLHPSDTEILRKINKKYGKKYNKRIMRIVQQNRSDNTHLLAVPPQILAYSFQYLSFKEVSAITPVCCYFTYLVHTFPALCHHHIHLNQRFFLSAMRNRVHLKHLSHFKSVEISCAYFDVLYSWKDGTKYRWILFKHILYHVIHHSVCSLHTLKINIEHAFGKMYGTNIRNVLLMILNKHDVFHITNLQWFSDYFLPATETSSILNTINDTICLKLPDLEHFVCGINRFRCRRWGGNGNSTLNISSISTCIAFTVNHYKHLKTLHLKCSEWNIYQHNTNLIDLIAQKLPKLEELTIISCVAPDDTSFELRNKFKHKSLHKLKTEFICNSNNGEGFGETIHHILRALFNVFGDIRTFSFGLFFNDRNIPPPSLDFTMHWRFLFGQLKQIKHLQITSISYDDAIAIVNQFDGTLVTLDMCVVFKNYYESLWSRSTVSRVIAKFGIFMTQYLLPLVKRHKNDVTAALKHL
eukprot:646568_1